jgi:hypothetical protein
MNKEAECQRQCVTDMDATTQPMPRMQQTVLEYTSNTSMNIDLDCGSKNETWFLLHA